MSSSPPKKQKSNDGSSASAYDYDLIVIGGGSGGLAAAKEAKKIQPELRVAVFDFVTPSPQGTTWRLGGTCVNVGCIPKKLMHYAGLMHHTFEDARALGWDLPAREAETHNWRAMLTAVNNYIRSLNYAFKNSLAGNDIEYFNSYAKFVDAHTVAFPGRDENGNEVERRVSAAHFILAPGGRPTLPTPEEVPGARELAISSDDIFWRKTPPGKTLVVGASYIALECAGFLHELGYDVTVMVRSVLLRGFDQQVAQQIGEVMERDGVRFVRPAVPKRLERSAESGRIVATWDSAAHGGAETTEEFDTVLYAIGRTANTHSMGLAEAGVAVSPKSGKILVDAAEQTSVPHIFAVGDVIEAPADQPKRQELTPVAIQAGLFLVRRLYAGSTKLMDYVHVPTAVFTPVEYGSVGLSQEEAEAALGADNVEVFVSRYNQLETAPTQHEYHEPRSTCFIDENLWARQHALSHGQEWEDFKAGTYEHQDRAMQFNHNKSLAKLIVDKTRDNRVVGFHYLGPNAGEITQGFALAVRAGVTKQDFDDLVGIHPTMAEEFTVLDHTLRSGANFTKKEGCGGGGSCG